MSPHRPATPERPHVLLTNDDGIEADGLRVLAEAMAPVADLTIVAPSHENSGMGHAITVFRDLHFEPHRRNGEVWGWGLAGTPADCVKVAVALLGGERPFDLVMSGINRGQNAGINVLYSGTVAAAREAAIYGLPAIAMSLFYREENHLPYETAGRVAVEAFELIRRHPLPRGIMLNVNVPPVDYHDLQGWAVTRMGDSGYTDYFLRQGEEAGVLDAPRPPGTPAEGSPAPSAHRPAGTYRNIGKGWNPSRLTADNLDDHALAANKVSVTPLQFDLTAYEILSDMQAWIK